MRYSKFVTIAASGLCALALAGCGGTTDADTDGDGEITAAEANAAVDAAGSDLKPQPGKYKATMTFMDANIPGAPPEMKAMMGKSMSNTFEICLTPEEAERGFEGAMTEGRDGCKIKSFTINGNDLNMAMTCDDAASGQMDVAMTGKVTPTKSDMVMTMNGTMSEFGPMEMKMSFVQERIGECDGKETVKG